MAASAEDMKLFKVLAKRPLSDKTTVRDIAMIMLPLRRRYDGYNDKFVIPFEDALWWANIPIEEATIRNFRKKFKEDELFDEGIEYIVTKDPSNPKKNRFILSFRGFYKFCFNEIMQNSKALNTYLMTIDTQLLQLRATHHEQRALDHARILAELGIEDLNIDEPVVAKERELPPNVYMRAMEFAKREYRDAEKIVLYVVDKDKYDIKPIKETKLRVFPEPRARYGDIVDGVVLQPLLNEEALYWIKLPSDKGIPDYVITNIQYDIPCFMEDWKVELKDEEKGIIIYGEEKKIHNLESGIKHLRKWLPKQLDEREINDADWIAHPNLRVVKIARKPLIDEMMRYFNGFAKRTYRIRNIVD